MSELTDTQNEIDDRAIPIDRVGIKGLRFPVQVREKGGETQRTVATAALTVDLPANLKGTHMSRFVEALHEQGGILDVKTVEDLPKDLLSRLSATRAFVEFQFPFFISKAAPISGKAGLVDYEVRFSVDVDAGGGSDFVLTVIVPVSTLCPCSKAISERGAHNQRGTITYSVRSTEPIEIEEMISIAEKSASCELYSVLKRPDEKSVTERAYDTPVFVEDVVRNVAAFSNEDERITWYRIEVENFESIHNHSAYAVIEKSVSL
jgi:GTP cyclohydrolase I